MQPISLLLRTSQIKCTKTERYLLFFFDGEQNTIVIPILKNTLDGISHTLLGLVRNQTNRCVTNAPYLALQPAFDSHLTSCPVSILRTVFSRVR
jgi:hypothetical protein